VTWHIFTWRNFSLSSASVNISMWRRKPMTRKHAGSWMSDLSCCKSWASSSCEQCFTSAQIVCNQSIIVYCYNTSSTMLYSYNTSSTMLYNYNTSSTMLYSYNTSSTMLYSYNTSSTMLYSYNTSSTMLYSYNTSSTMLYSYNTSSTMFKVYLNFFLNKNKN